MSHCPRWRATGIYLCLVLNGLRQHRWAHLYSSKEDASNQRSQIYTYPEDMPFNKRANPILHAVALCCERTCARQSDYHETLTGATNDTPILRGSWYDMPTDMGVAVSSIVATARARLLRANLCIYPQIDHLHSDKWDDPINVLTIGHTDGF